jgi:hypothetical protein
MSDRSVLIGQQMLDPSWTIKNRVRGGCGSFSIEGRLRPDIIAWLHENNFSNNYITRMESRSGFGVCYSVLFENDKAAIAFRMRWC